MVRRVVLSPGTTDLAGTVANLREADLIVSGEPREWEAVEYVADTAVAGESRSLLAIGRIVSQNPACTRARRGCAALSETCPSTPFRLVTPSETFRMTGQELVGRIQQKLAAQGIQWREESRDTFKAGEPETPVRGIATTGMATFDVLKRAAANGRNFVVTHEPTFYNDKDLLTGLEADPTYLAKQRFIAANRLIVWRFHDHAHAMRPDPLIAGSARALG